jgi:hypothetical protein
MYMKKGIMLLFCWLLSPVLRAQDNPKAIEELKQKLAAATTDSARVWILGEMSRMSIAYGIDQSDEYGRRQIEEAEKSRNRKLMTRAFMDNGDRYSYVGTANRSYAQKSLSCYTQAYELARANKFEKEMAGALLGMTNLHISQSENDQALNKTNQAFAILSNTSHDRLKIDCYNAYGLVYQVKKEKILALRNYLNALRLAEESPNLDEEARNKALGSCYDALVVFYTGVPDYDKALDYATKALSKISGPRAAYNRVSKYNTIGQLYGQKKNLDLATSYYEKSIALADSLKFEPLKMQGYMSILNQYLKNNQAEKALEYMEKKPEIREYMNRFGFSKMIDNVYGYIYTSLKRYDSARVFYARARPYFEKETNGVVRAYFFLQLATFEKATGNTKAALESMLKVKTDAEAGGDLGLMKDVYQQLDSVYQTMGDYKQAAVFNNLYHTMKDSVEKLGKEKDLLQMELEDETQREERRAKEKQLEDDRRHNLQYMAITIAIAMVFVILVLLGVFSVSKAVVKTLGFFAFIFLFEFIIMIADHKIHAITHGEPLKILLIKIVLIALLLPLHHFLEEKVIHYLTSRKRLDLDRHKGWWKRLLKPKTTSENKP